MAEAGTAEKSATFTALVIVLALALGTWLYVCLPYDEAPRKGLALLAFIAVLWLTEALHLAVTALLVPVGALLLGFPGLTTTKAFATFADPIVFLFFGGFALATALHIQQLDRKMAYALLALARGHLGVAICLMFAATALISCGISNTATAAMMLPLAMGILGPLDDPAEHRTRTFVLLGVAYAASLGGMGTLVGSPPNAIAARAAGLDFAQWLWIGIPLVLVLMPAMVLVLWLLLRPRLHRTVDIATQDIPWTMPRALTMAVFLLAALGWTLGDNLLKGLGIQNPDTFVAVAAAVLVVALGLASWKQVAAHTDWGVLILFGGGLGLGMILEVSGASRVLGGQVAGALYGTSPWVMVLSITAFMVLLSEFTSNTAATALMVPVFSAIAARMGLPTETLVVLVALAASCGFALPVATPPNALVFATGQIPQRQMLKAGLGLDLACIAVLTLWALLALNRGSPV
ncbi:MAG: DASS family sodium-coupled anion symporter [Proteobacteria bacterium]|nr:DASS family sodium-coupled anion symporter [Pseudomonadota bacterium]